MKLTRILLVTPILFINFSPLQAADLATGTTFPMKIFSSSKETSQASAISRDGKFIVGFDGSYVSIASILDSPPSYYINKKLSDAALTGASDNGILVGNSTNGPIIWDDNGINFLYTPNLDYKGNSSQTSHIPAWWKVRAITPDGKYAVGTDSYYGSVSSSGLKQNGTSAVYWDLGQSITSNGSTTRDLHEYKLESSEGAGLPSTDIATAISDNGNVIVGYNGGKEIPLIWYRGITSSPITLPTGNLQGRALAVSRTGSIIGGYQAVATSTPNFPLGSKINDEGNINGTATIWHGTNWRSVAKLNSLKSNGLGSSRVNALSQEGDFAAGYAQNDANEERAILWYGTDWSSTYDLGTFKSDNSGNSRAKAISGDGTKIVGWSDSDDGSGKVHAAVWVVTPPAPLPPTLPPTQTTLPPTQTTLPPNQTTLPATQLTPGDTVVQPTINVVKIDITNTRNSLARLGSETFNALEFQREALSDLQNGCDTSDGQYCFSVFGNTRGSGGARGTSTGFRFGAPIGDYISSGASISYTNSEILNAFHDSSSRYGFGAYVEYHQPEDSRQWFVRPSISYSKYDTKINRGYESKTEIANGKAEIKGISETIEFGKRFSYNDKQLSISSGVQHSKISRSSYSEINAVLPVSYDEVDFDDTAAFVRGSITSAITPSVKLVVNAELDLKMGGSKPVFQAEGDYIGSVDNKASINKTRESFSAGFIYSPTKQISLSVIPTIGQSALGEKHWSTNLNIDYNF